MKRVAEVSVESKKNTAIERIQSAFLTGVCARSQTWCGWVFAPSVRAWHGLGLMSADDPFLPPEEGSPGGSQVVGTSRAPGMVAARVAGFLNRSGQGGRKPVAGAICSRQAVPFVLMEALPFQDI